MLSRNCFIIFFYKKQKKSNFNAFVSTSFSNSIIKILAVDKRVL